MTKRETLDALKTECFADLAEFVVFGQCVFGQGNENSPLALVGEAPGRFEAEQGIPFVGTAGKNLDALLAMADIRREEIYITNAVKVRPARPGKRAGTFTNRPPAAKEIARCRDYLLKELSVVQPEIVATLGNTPLRALLGQAAPAIGGVHGKLLKTDEFPFRIFPLYHPASVIYNRALSDALEEDMRALGELMRQNESADASV